MASQVFKQSVWYWARRHNNCNSTVNSNDDSNGSSDTAEADPTQDSGSVVRKGVVVILGWMLSTPKQLLPYTRLYNSLGWDCLVCHPHILNLFFPSMTAALALSVLLELVQCLERRPCPVVFVSFSGGHKACLYKIIQILLGQCPETKDDKRILTEVVRSVAGIVFDSGPMEFDSSIGAKVVSQQMLTFKPGKSLTMISHGAHALGRGLDIIFKKQLGLQRVDLWHALYSCVNMGPILVLCSDNDKLAPLETIHMFSSNLLKLGGQVDVVVWEGSKHVIFGVIRSNTHWK